MAETSWPDRRMPEVRDGGRTAGRRRERARAGGSCDFATADRDEVEARRPRRWKVTFRRSGGDRDKASNGTDDLPVPSGKGISTKSAERVEEEKEETLRAVGSRLAGDLPLGRAVFQRYSARRSARRDAPGRSGC